MSKILTTSSDKSLLGGVSYTSKHNGKMTGIHSISTSCLENPLCQARRKNGNSICASCFAAAMMEDVFKNGMPQTLAENTRILTSSILDDSVIPLFPTRDGRIESFGDLVNWIQAANYIKIIRKNPSTHFGWWTKNPWLIKEAIDNGYALPDNVEIVLSSLEVNKPDAVDEEKYPFITKVFTVYTKEYLKSHPEVHINCGARSCLACERCYRRNPEGTKIQYINEILKKR